MLALTYSCTPLKFVAAKAVGWAWKGVDVSPLGSARLAQVSPPPLPPAWAMVRVLQCGLCTSDLHLIRLQFSLRSAVIAAAAASAEPAPVILGHELVGVVEQAAADCPLAVGQRVVSIRLVPQLLQPWRRAPARDAPPASTRSAIATDPRRRKKSEVADTRRFYLGTFCQPPACARIALRRPGDAR